MYFVQDSKWHTSQDNYNKFISGNEGKSTVFLELGVGYNTPGIIRFPFEAMVRNNPNALLVRLNRDHMNGMSEILGSTTSFVFITLELCLNFSRGHKILKPLQESLFGTLGCVIDIIVIRPE